MGRKGGCVGFFGSGFGEFRGTCQTIRVDAK
jgi:hypothetical protein